MPRMDGLTALEKIMKDCPTSVMMVSSLTTEGADETIKALEYGAVDFIPKELSYVNINIIKIKEELVNKVKEIVKHKILRERLRRVQKLNQHFSYANTSLIRPNNIPSIGFKAVGIGISTGGPFSLQKVIPLLSKKINCPIFIVQHMPPKFTKSLAERLDGLSELEVKEAEDNEIVRNGVVYIAQGGLHMTLARNSNGSIVIKISDKPSETLHRPSVDVIAKLVHPVWGLTQLLIFTADTLLVLS